MTENPEFPRKTRELHNHHFDFTIWNDLNFREDDIIIAAYKKRAEAELGTACARWLATGERDSE
jgi:aryl sulfotransferase